MYGLITYVREHITMQDGSYWPDGWFIITYSFTADDGYHGPWLWADCWNDSWVQRL